MDLQYFMKCTLFQLLRQKQKFFNCCYYLFLQVIAFNIAHLDIQTSQLNKCNLLLIVPGTGNRTWD